MYPASRSTDGEPVLTGSIILDRVRFGLWQGVVHRPGKSDIFKVYYNLLPRRAGHARRLASVAELLDEHLPASHCWSKAHPFVSDGTEATMIGVDYGASGVTKAKCYYRCTVPWQKAQVLELLAALAPADVRPTFVRFHKLVTYDAPVFPERALMISVGIANKFSPIALNLHVNLHSFFSPRTI